MPMTVTEKGRREAASRARASGTIVSIKESGEQCVVRCEDHGQQTTAPKWSVACDVARRPADWCSVCKEAGPPAPKPKPEKKSKGGKAPKDQTAEERDANLELARAEKARLAKERAKEEARLAKARLPELRKSVKAAAREYDKAFGAASRYNGGDNAQFKKLWQAADRAQNAVIHTGRVLREAEALVAGKAASDG